MKKPTRYSTLSKKILFLSTCFVLTLGPARAQEAPVGVELTVPDEEVNMVVGELESVKVSGITRISLTNPAIADIVNYDETEILLIAKTIGQTVLFVWDDQGKRPIFINVSQGDLENTAKRIKNLLTAADIQTVQFNVNPKEAKIVLTGEIIADKKGLFDQLIEPFNAAVVNLVKVEPIQDLVQIDMQITELNTTLNESIGVDWNDALEFEEELIANDFGPPENLFKIGDFQRTTQLLAVVNALVTEGKGRILSKPKLVVVSGQEASFLVGGEIPIKSTTVTDTGSTENTEFKEYGISMTVTPAIVQEKIDLTLNIEVSDVDASTAGTSETDVGFTTRTADTHLFLDDGQTIVLAGLIKQSVSKSISRVPFLGSIPVVGLLFRNKSNPVADVDQELVVSLTPHILTDRKLEKEKKLIAQANTNKQKPGSTMSSDPASLTVPYYLGIPKEMDAYVQSIQDRISKAISYPQEAQEKGWEGTVKLGLLILQDGTLAYATIKESSGQEVFDELTLNTARMAAPYEGFPADTDLRELNITIPIVYSLNR